MLDARFSHLYFCQSLHTLQRGLAAIAGVLVLFRKEAVYLAVFLILKTMLGLL